MRDARRRYDANFKAQVAMEALKGIKTMAELSSEYKLHATQIQGWKRLLQKEAVSLFQDGRSRQNEGVDDRLVETLFGKIGRLEVELDFLKKRDGSGPWRRLGR